jgi:hypothetical protein
MSIAKAGVYQMHYVMHGLMANAGLFDMAGVQ